MAGEALVEQHAEAEDVGAHVDVAALDLLGRHVRGRAQHLPRRRHALRVEDLGDPEIGELDDHAEVRGARLLHGLALALARLAPLGLLGGRAQPARAGVVVALDRVRRLGRGRGQREGAGTRGAGRVGERGAGIAVVRGRGRGRGRGARSADAVLRELDEHVLGLDVPVDDRRLVGVLHRLAELEHDGRADLGGHVAVIDEHLAQRGAAEQLDHQVALGVVLARDVEDLDDARVVELGGGARLGDEARADLGVLAEVLVDDLDGDLAPEPQIARPVHRRHATVADLFQELVLRELREAGRHGGESHSTTRTRMALVVPVTPTGAP